MLGLIKPLQANQTFPSTKQQMSATEILHARDIFPLLVQDLEKGCFLSCFEAQEESQGGKQASQSASDNSTGFLITPGVFCPFPG